MKDFLPQGLFLYTNSERFFAKKATNLDVEFNTKIHFGNFQILQLTLEDPFISESCIKIKIELNFFHTSLWCLKRFYEGL